MGVLDVPVTPVARDQFKPTDVLLRATQSNAQVAANGSSVILVWEMAGFASFCIQMTGDSNSFSVEGSNDLNLWTTLDVRALGTFDAPLGATWFQENNAPCFVGANKSTKFVRISSVAMSGSNSGVLVVLSQQPLSPMRPSLAFGPDQSWAAAAPSGGVVNNTPVTLRAATNPFHRNIVTALQISNGGATGTEAILTDTSGPTVIWRDYLPGNSTRGGKFTPPLRCGASGALTLTLTAASGAAVYANVQGIVGLA